MITVVNNNDSGVGSFRQALIDAAIGETIDFAISGTILLSSAELTIAQNQIITGPGSGSLTIDGGSAFRCLNVTSGVVSVTGLTLANGNGGDGAGLRNLATLTISDMIVDSCASSGNGGGVFNQSTIVATDLFVTNNTAVGTGGGIHNDGSATLTITNGSINNNQSGGRGGGLYENSGTVILDRVPIRNNESTVSGGGFYSTGTLTLTDLTVADNIGVATGGGVIEGTATFIRSTLNGHIEGIRSIAGSVYLINSTFSGNTGVAIFNDLGAVDIRHSTVTNNGTGIHQESSGIISIRTYNSILAGNITSDYDGDTADIISEGHNIFGNNTNPITPAAGDISILTFAGLVLGLLADNGGFTLTHAVLIGSPALNAGNIVAAPATDQRGDTRIVGTSIDIGAFEAGCLMFEGILPEWATRSGNCILVTAGEFSGATQLEANAAAQSALDSYVAQATTDGELFCNS